MPAPLQPDVKARLREVILTRVLPRFGNDPKRQQSEAARKLDVHPSAINRLVNKGEGGSVDLIEKVERLLNEPKGTILGYRGEAPAVPKFSAIQGFDEAVLDAARRCQDNKIPLTKRDLENAGSYSLSPQPERITADLLIQVALAFAGDSPTTRKPTRRKK